MPAEVPQLVVWPLSGIKVDQEGFQRELHKYWNPPGEIMSHSSNVGLVGVRNSLEIPLGSCNRYSEFFGRLA